MDDHTQPTKNEYIDNAVQNMRMNVISRPEITIEMELFLLTVIDAFEDYLTETLPNSFREEETE